MGTPVPLERIVIVTRKTELEELILRFCTAGQAEFYLTSAGQDFAAIKRRHEKYHASLSVLRKALPATVKTILVDRSHLAQLEFLQDFVIAIGQDGLVSNTAKYLDDQPLMGVNPDAQSYEGVLLPWRPETAARGLADYLSGKSKIEGATLAQATMRDGRSLLAFNDLFIGPATHGSARYHISYRGQSEFQSSSGLIISTGAGSTGWLSSVHRGACVIANALGSYAMVPENNGKFSRSADKLVFAVREPWPSRTTGTSLVYGDITPGEPLKLVSDMATGGTVFSDGVEWDNLDFNAGTEVTVSIAARKTQLLIA